MDDSKGLSYFMLGLGIGVAVGIVFAPQSGEDTRGQIRSKALERCCQFSQTANRRLRGVRRLCFGRCQLPQPPR